ncbi:hypothetical protein LIA77_07901 [Sarocladium implicatum]|nr:hypothetical protein LIA77_07901 [Sarocladium implicatum]
MAPVPPAIIESRAEYVAGSLILIVRWLIRLKTLGGIRGWRWDDWFSVSVFVWHTALFAMVEYLAVKGAPLGFTQEMREALTPQMREDMTKGAKGMYASFFILICLVWSAKGVLLAFFLQLTRQTRMHAYVWTMVGVSAACFLAACFATFFHCLPIRRNWQILPDPGFECSAGVTQNIVIAAGNVLVDGMLLVVPIRTMATVQLPYWKKLGITFLMSLGLFVMAMAIVRCVFSVDNGPGVAQSSVWVFREALVTIFAINAPVLVALFRRDTYQTRKGTNSGYQHTGSGSNGYGGKSGMSGSHNHMQTIGGSFVERSSTRDQDAKGLEIYKMTDIETSSKESTTNLVMDRHAHVVPVNLR